MSTQKNRSRLGRGLSSLIPVHATIAESQSSPPPPPPGRSEAAALGLTELDVGPLSADVISPSAPPPGSARNAGQPLQLRLDLIHPNPHQPRKEFSDSSLAELAASLKSSGVIQPIIVRQTAAGFELIAGERRLRAAKLANLETIPVIVRDVDGFTQAQMALVENIHREDLNPVDRAGAYRALIDQLGLTQSELAARLGEDRSSIANFLRLLDLAPPVLEMVRTAQLSLGHAKLLAGVSLEAEQIRLANLVSAQTLSVRNLERLLSEESTKTPERTKKMPSAHLADLEKNLARQLGMRTQVRAGAKGKGRLTIHFGSLDQFDELLSRLGVESEPR